MSKLALVTGASGFTGGHLARSLASRGYAVRALVREGSDLSGLSATESIELFPGDVRDAKSVDRSLEGVDIVFHLAALYRSARHSDDVYWQTNVEGTRHVLEASRRHQIQRLVHCSTIGVHGDIREVPADESAPLRPGDVYQETKVAAEKLVQQFIRDGLAASIVRPAGIYGPGDRRFLKLFRMIKSRRFRMFGSGETLMHLVYIDDLIDGFLRCAEQPQAIGNTYIVAGERYVTLNELASQVAHSTKARLRSDKWPYRPLWLAACVCEAACRSVAIEPPLHRRRVEFFAKNRAFDIGKAMNELGFRPQVDLSLGIERTANWYRHQGWL